MVWYAINTWNRYMRSDIRLLVLDIRTLGISRRKHISHRIAIHIQLLIMKLATFFQLIPLFLGVALGQNYPECTRELLRTDECAAVVNPNACYNQFRWSARTLSCIDGENDTQRKQRVCHFCRGSS
jgi:hypothetical protein